MARRWKARSATPGDRNFKAGSLGFAPAVGDVKTTAHIGDGTAGTLNMGLYTLTSGIVWPAVGSVLVAEAAWGPTGAEYAGAYVDPADGDVWHGVAVGVSPRAGTKVGSSITNLAVGNLASGVTVDDVGPGTFTHTADYTAIAGVAAAGDVRLGTARYSGGGNGTWDAVSKASVVAAAWVVVGNSNYVGGDAGTYPTTATTEAAQLATDRGAVLASAAFIQSGHSILAQAGTLDTAALEAAAAAAQLVTDQGVVYAARIHIEDGYVLLGQTGTQPAVYPSIAYVHADAGDYGPTGVEYTPGLSALANWLEIITPDPTDAVIHQCLTSAGNVIKGLGLTGITSASIEVRKLPWSITTDVRPGIFICPGRESLSPASNERVGVDYPIDIVMVRASNHNLTDAMDTFLGWRESIRVAFTPTVSNRPIMASVSKAFSVRVEPGTVYDGASFALMHDVGVVRVIVSCREGGT